jgi:hypothetical protein
MRALREFGYGGIACIQSRECEPYEEDMLAFEHSGWECPNDFPDGVVCCVAYTHTSNMLARTIAHTISLV